MRTVTKTTAALTILLAATLLSGCDGGPSFIEGHDYSAFYDFGGGEDTIGPDDGGTDAFARDIGPDEDGWTDAGLRDTTGDDTAAGDTGNDTATPTVTVDLITDREWETLANQMINGAKSSVDLVHLEFLSYPDTREITIANSLKAAAGRGVPVRVILDDEVDGNQTKIDEFNSVGNMLAKLDNSDITTHAKLLIVDGTQVLVGSTNLSKSALHFNHEANLYIDAAAAALEYVDYFNAIWNKPGTKAGMDATMTDGILPIGDGEYIGAVTPLLEQATDRINLVMYHFTNGDLADALIEADKSGVDVRVFLESCDYLAYINDDNNDMAGTLEAGGVTVRFDESTCPTNPVTTHAKLLIVDDAVVVYSGNWNNSALTYNHEAGAIVDGVPSVTKAAVAYFNGLWNSGVDY